MAEPFARAQESGLPAAVERVGARWGGVADFAQRNLSLGAGADASPADVAGAGRMRDGVLHAGEPAGVDALFPMALWAERADAAVCGFIRRGTQGRPALD